MFKLWFACATAFLSLQQTLELGMVQRKPAKTLQTAKHSLRPVKLQVPREEDRDSFSSAQKRSPGGIKPSCLESDSKQRKGSAPFYI